MKTEQNHLTACRRIYVMHQCLTYQPAWHSFCAPRASTQICAPKTGRNGAALPAQVMFPRAAEFLPLFPRNPSSSGDSASAEGWPRP